MKILYFCPRWGSDHIPLETFLDQVKEAGYDGVEIGLHEDEQEQAALLHNISAKGLLYILQHWETTNPDFEQHEKEYLQRISKMAACSPYAINSHTGRDFFSVEQNLSLIQKADSIATENNVLLTHETHRSRFAFAAHVIAPYLLHPDLKLTFDVSHWICVAETLLFDQQHIIDKITPQVRHIHARIGHTQGPQVLDPQNGYWKETTERHLQLWDNIVQYHSELGTKELAITTEFGPAPYMPLLTPLPSDFDLQWNTNLWMLQLLKTRYKDYQ